MERNRWRMREERMEEDVGKGRRQTGNEADGNEETKEMRRRKRRESSIGEDGGRRDNEEKEKRQ